MCFMSTTQYIFEVNIYGSVCLQKVLKISLISPLLSREQHISGFFSDKNRVSTNGWSFPGKSTIWQKFLDL
jgi:hypothetical protein